MTSLAKHELRQTWDNYLSNDALEYRALFKVTDIQQVAPSEPLGTR